MALPQDSSRISIAEEDVDSQVNIEEEKLENVSDVHEPGSNAKLIDNNENQFAPPNESESDDE